MGQNRLANESSLYLRQHADNPVEWWPWCEEAFATAEREGKPVLVSIGYASCHWCHVMAHECFEDTYVASLMNRMFINIKVDREERPDVDQIYMEALQMLGQQGGWPLNVFCFPDKKPFTGGTYFPPEDRGFGIIPWPHLLLRIADAYQHETDELRSNADAIQNNLKFLSNSVLEVSDGWDDRFLVEGARAILGTLDSRYGGFGSAPKFPPCQVMGFLLAVRSMEICDGEDEKFAESLDEAVRLCCHAMVRGGLFDHVGGGFFRYSVDAQWRVPHFEKMLYDNALLLEVLSKAWSRCRWQGLEGPVRKTIQWLMREFEVQRGIFASALDADTPAGEGAYYLWSEAELRESISSTEVESFLEGFSVHGKDALNLYPWAVEDDAYRKFAPILHDLMELRENREHPTLDRKILLSWNSLLLRSLVISGFVFGENAWLEKAREGLDWLWTYMRRQDGTLASVYYPESNMTSSGEGFLDDYVNFALANVHFACVADCLETGLSACYKTRAVQLTKAILERFSDRTGEGEGFFFCSETDAQALIVRKKEWFDHAYPSGNSGIIHLLSLLSAVDQSLDYQGELAAMQLAYVDRARRMPNGVAFGMEGLTWHSAGIVTIKVGTSVDLKCLARGIRSKPWRPLWICVDESLDVSQLQLCVGARCLVVTDVAEEVLNAF